jgi:uncharacterized protein (TIGR00369 family)
MSDAVSVDPVRAWSEPVRGGHPDPALFGLSGVEQLRAVLAGYQPRAPLSHLTGLRLVEVGIGTAVFEMPLSGWLRAPQGGISIGPLAIAADAALGCAVQSGLPAATPLTTSELSLRLLAPAQPGTSVIARGELIHARRTIALSEVLLTDTHGRLLAHGSSLCFVLPQLSPAREPPSELERLEPARYETPDPWERAPQGEVVSQEVWDRLSGLEVMRTRLAGELGGSAPIAQLTGLRLQAVSEGGATFVMPATEWLTAPPPGRVQGGAVALLAETALSAAIQTALPAKTALAPIDLKVNYLRPLASDGREATARGTVAHAGRRIAVAHADVHDADGKPVALATGSAMILPGRAASLASVEDAPLEAREAPHLPRRRS